MVRLFFDVHERIVQKTLESLADASLLMDATQRPVIVGGIAIQLYASDERGLLRPTSDVDIIDPQNSEYLDFVRGIGSTLRRDLREDGYQVQLKRGRDKNEVKIMHGQHEAATELFFAHLTRYSPEVFGRTKPVTEREVQNASTLELPYGQPIKVKRIEDMLTHKIKRVRRSLRELAKMGALGELDPLYASLFSAAENSDWDELAKLELSAWCNGITKVQNAMVAHAAPDTSDKLRYKINKDLYDLCLLSRIIGGKPDLFNRAYFESAKREVDSI